jgi:DNA-binding LytR/AlgR family response regulator
LKPFTTASVTAALQKFKNLTQVKQEEISRQYESIRRLFSDSKTAKPSSLLIHYKDTILPVKIADIALFRLENEIVYLLTFDQTTYYPGKSLEELEDIVGDDFFRVNRQYLVSRKAIVNASSLFSRKLSLSVSVPVKESITISKEKAPLFLKWLSGVAL